VGVAKFVVVVVVAAADVVVLLSACKDVCATDDVDGVVVLVVLFVVVLVALSVLAVLAAADDGCVDPCVVDVLSVVRNTQHRAVELGFKKPLNFQKFNFNLFLFLLFIM